MKKRLVLIPCSCNDRHLWLRSDGQFFQTDYQRKTSIYQEVADYLATLGIHRGSDAIWSVAVLNHVYKALTGPPSQSSTSVLFVRLSEEESPAGGLKVSVKQVPYQTMEPGAVHWLSMLLCGKHVQMTLTHTKIGVYCTHFEATPALMPA